MSSLLHQYRQQEERVARYKQDPWVTNGFYCPICKTKAAIRMEKNRFECQACGHHWERIITRRAVKHG